MDQFVIVSFPDSRTVFVDGTPCGPTNEVMTVERGTHRFDLGDPLDYDPPSIVKFVVGTTEQNPMRLAFTKV
jgi:hypothetical protein